MEKMPKRPFLGALSRSACPIGPEVTGALGPRLRRGARASSARAKRPGSVARMAFEVTLSTSSTAFRKSFHMSSHVFTISIPFKTCSALTYSDYSVDFAYFVYLFMQTIRLPWACLSSKSSLTSRCAH